jgi:hypothetical protein
MSGSSPEVAFEDEQQDAAVLIGRVSSRPPGNRDGNHYLPDAVPFRGRKRCCAPCLLSP